MAACCTIDELHYTLERVQTVVEQEPGSGGKESAQNAIQRLKAHRVKAVRPTTNKEARAESLANAIAYGEVYLIRGQWNAPFLEELRDFPAGKYKDQVDAAALAYLVGVGQSIKPKPAIIAGLRTTVMCKSHGCDRPAADDLEHCCHCCALTSESNDTTMKVDHSKECHNRASKHFNKHGYSSPEPVGPRLGLGGLARW